MPPQAYGGTERVVSFLTEELVQLGHNVTLFASGDSVTAAELVPVCPRSLRLSKSPDPIAHHFLMLSAFFPARVSSTSFISISIIFISLFPAVIRWRRRQLCMGGSIYLMLRHMGNLATCPWFQSPTPNVRHSRLRTGRRRFITACRKRSLGTQKSGGLLRIHWPHFAGERR